MSVPSPDAAADTKAIEDKSLDTQDVIDILGEDDVEESAETIKLEKDRKDDKKDSKESGESKEEDDEEKEPSLEDELEEEIKEPEDEDLELVDVPRRKEILAAFPDLFKKFPQIEKAMYRERAYSEILPTIEDAKNAVEKAQTLDEHEAELSKGTIAGILGVVHDGDKAAFAKIVDDYMPALYRTDQQAYYHTIGNITRHTIISMVNDAKTQNDDNLANAAAVLNQYMFGTTQFTHPQNLSKDSVQDPKTREKESEISEREEALAKRQFEDALGTIDNRVDRVLEATIEKHIDPKETMSAYTRRKAIEQVHKELESSIENDTRFKRIYDTMWLKAKDQNYSKESMDKLYRAYVSKAGTLLSGIISKVRKEAMADVKSRESGNGDTRKERDRRGPLPVGKTRGSAPINSGKTDNSSTSKKAVPRGMTTLEYLNSED